MISLESKIRKHKNKKSSKNNKNVIIKSPSTVIVKKIIKKNGNPEQKTLLQKHKNKIIVAGTLASIAFANRKKIRNFYTKRAVEIGNQIVDRQRNKLIDNLLAVIKSPVTLGKKALDITHKKINELKSGHNKFIIEIDDNLKKNEKFQTNKYKKLEEFLILNGELSEECSHILKLPGGFVLCENQKEADKLIESYIDSFVLDTVDSITQEMLKEFLDNCSKTNFDLKCLKKVNDNFEIKLSDRLINFINKNAKEIYKKN